MKYVHDGVEYDVADLRLAVRESAKAELLDNHPHTARCLFSAAALLARHEREHEALDSIASGALQKRECQEVARTALRGEEDHRG